MSGPDRIWAFDYDLQDDDGTWRNWQCWSDAHPEPLNATEYIRRDPAVLAALPEVQAIVDAAVKAEREACAEVCEEWGAWNNTAQAIAYVIRRRGEGHQ